MAYRSRCVSRDAPPFGHRHCRNRGRDAQRTDDQALSQALDRILVGDVGGTHARFAVVDTSATRWTISSPLDVDGTFETFEAALTAYLDRSGVARPAAASIAVAGPVTNAEVKLTNRNWTIREQDLRTMGFADALLINDFACLCFAIPALAEADVHVLGPNLPVVDDQPVAILGAGTGFGAACLARFRGRSAPLSTEGGHAGFAPGNAREVQVLERLMKRFGHVSIERVLSGPGLQNVYRALCEIEGRSAAELEPADIVANRKQDPVCREAVEMFCAVYGSVAGDFALSYGARGGVYLAGGIAQKIEPILNASQFRARFEDKGRMSPFVQPIATRLIVTEDMAYLGAAGALLAFRASP